MPVEGDEQAICPRGLACESLLHAAGLAA